MASIGILIESKMYFQAVAKLKENFTEKVFHLNTQIFDFLLLCEHTQNEIEFECKQKNYHFVFFPLRLIYITTVISVLVEHPKKVTHLCNQYLL